MGHHDQQGSEGTRKDAGREDREDWRQGSSGGGQGTATGQGTGTGQGMGTGGSMGTGDDSLGGETSGQTGGMTGGQSGSRQQRGQGSGTDWDDKSSGGG